MTPDPVTTDSAQLARRALFGFILTLIAARTVVLLIMSHRMPNLYFFLRGTHVHHLNCGIFLLAAVGGYLLFSARRSGLASRSHDVWRRDGFEKAFIALAVALTAFGVVLYDTSLKIGRLEGPRLEALELSSSP